MRPGVLMLAAGLLAGCASGGLAGGELPQAPGTVRPGRQARYERPAGQDQAAAPSKARTPAGRLSRQEVLLWLLIGLGVVGASTFAAEHASRRGRDREE